ncbi:MAG: hypothetical protein QXG86_00500 [Candidatus Woesearchaeota archaeon]
MVVLENLIATSLLTLENIIKTKDKKSRDTTFAVLNLFSGEDITPNENYDLEQNFFEQYRRSANNNEKAIVIADSIEQLYILKEDSEKIKKPLKKILEIISQNSRTTLDDLINAAVLLRLANYLVDTKKSKNLDCYLDFAIKCVTNVNEELHFYDLDNSASIISELIEHPRRLSRHERLNLEFSKNKREKIKKLESIIDDLYEEKKDRSKEEKDRWLLCPLLSKPLLQHLLAKLVNNERFYFAGLRDKEGEGFFVFSPSDPFIYHLRDLDTITKDFFWDKNDYDKKLENAKGLDKLILSSHFNIVANRKLLAIQMFPSDFYFFVKKEIKMQENIFNHTYKEEEHIDSGIEGQLVGLTKNNELITEHMNKIFVWDIQDFSKIKKISEIIIPKETLPFPASHIKVYKFEPNLNILAIHYENKLDLFHLDIHKTKAEEMMSIDFDFPFNDFDIHHTGKIALADEKAFKLFFVDFEKKTIQEKASLPHPRDKYTYVSNVTFDSSGTLVYVLDCHIPKLLKILNYSPESEFLSFILNYVNDNFESYVAQYSRYPALYPVNEKIFTALKKGINLFIEKKYKEKNSEVIPSNFRQITKIILADELESILKNKNINFSEDADYKYRIRVVCPSITNKLLNNSRKEYILYLLTPNIFGYKSRILKKIVSNTRDIRAIINDVSQIRNSLNEAREKVPYLINIIDDSFIKNKQDFRYYNTYIYPDYSFLEFVLANAVREMEEHYKKSLGIVDRIKEKINTIY